MYKRTRVLYMMYVHRKTEFESRLYTLVYGANNGDNSRCTCDGALRVVIGLQCKGVLV